MAKLTLQQISTMASDRTFQKRLYVAIYIKALYWYKTTNDPLLTKVAGQKYKQWAKNVINNTFNRTDEQNALMFLASYSDPVTGEDNPPLVTYNNVDQIADSALLGQSPNGGFYMDSFIKEWAGVDSEDEATDVSTPK